MVTDDAGIVEHKACQLETWVQRNQDSTDYWAVPACNFTGNLEVAVGGARLHDSGDKQTVGLIQGKTLFKPLETNGWGIGLVFGNQFITRQSFNGDLFAFIPISFSFQDDRLLLHTNLGWQHEREVSRDKMTWAIGSEIQVLHNTWMSVETFGQGQNHPYFQIGLRHWLAPDQVQIDTTYGNRFDHANGKRWFSIGLKFVTVPFLR